MVIWTFGPSIPKNVLFVFLGSECSAFSMLDLAPTSAGKGSLCPDHTTETIDLGANAHRATPINIPQDGGHRSHSLCQTLSSHWLVWVDWQCQSQERPCGKCLRVAVTDGKRKSLAGCAVLLRE